MTLFAMTGPSVLILLFVVGILFTAGMTKGVLGIGLPIVAVPLLSAFVPLPTAVALMTIPLVVTNFAQMITGELLRVVLRRLMPIFIGMVVGVFIGVWLLTGLSPATLKPVVGIALIGVAVLMLLSPKLVCPERLEFFLSPIVGIAGGILGGLAGQSGPLVFVYLLSLGMTGDRFVQYSSTYLVVASVVLTAALGRAGAIGWEGAALSALCALPILFGMRFGTRIRGRLPAGLFRTLVLGVVVLSGIDLCEPAIMALMRGHDGNILASTIAAPAAANVHDVADRP